MTETRWVVVCADCHRHWYADLEPATCSTAEHRHRRVEVHRHRSAVTLPDGTGVLACSFDHLDPYTRARTPQFGLYLDPAWAPPWPHRQVGWPDFGIPEDPTGVAQALRELLDRARRGQIVELGCLGGHGRTGVALACLATWCGHPAADAVGWVRDRYCWRAVETPEQEAFAVELAAVGTA